MFETDRLILRALRESDYDEVLRLYNDPLMQRLLVTDYIAPRGKKFVEEVLKDEVANALLVVMITLKDTGDWMGYCELRVNNTKNRDGVLSIALLKEYQNKGYGTEVLKFILNHGFRNCGLHRVSLVVMEGNGGAIAVYKKLGFVEEGRRRKGNWVDGKWEDVLWMGMLDREWTTPKNLESAFVKD